MSKIMVCKCDGKNSNENVILIHLASFFPLSQISLLQSQSASHHRRALMINLITGSPLGPHSQKSNYVMIRLE